MSGARFAKPKSLYVEATGVKDDGAEFVVKLAFDATEHSTMSLNMDAITVDDPSNGLYLVATPTGEHDVVLTMTRARIADEPDAAAHPRRLNTPKTVAELRELLELLDGDTRLWVSDRNLLYEVNVEAVDTAAGYGFVITRGDRIVW